MDERIKEIARKMGAKIVAELPEFGPGAIGAAQYGHFYRMRMEELRRQEQLQNHGVERVVSSRLELPISEATAHALTEIAEIVSTPEQPLTTAQIAERLLSQASREWLDAWHKTNQREEELKSQLAVR